MARQLTSLVVLAFACACASTQQRSSAPRTVKSFTPGPEACGELTVRPFPAPPGDVFTVGDSVVAVGSGSRPEYRPHVSVMDPQTLEWSALDPRGGPALVVGYSHYSISWIPVGDRLVGSYPPAFVVVDPDRMTWERAEVPAQLQSASHVITGKEIVFPSHRFDVERVKFLPSPPALQRHGPHWLALGQTIIAFDPVARTGASVSLPTGEERPLSFEGLPAVTGHVQVARLSGDRILVVGATPPPVKVAGAIYDRSEGRWTALADEALSFLPHDRIHYGVIPEAAGAWLLSPTGPQGPKVLHLLDAEARTFSSHPLPTGVNTLAAPNGIYVFDADSLRLFDPARGEVCRWSTAELPKNSMSGETWTPPGIHGRRVLDATGGLSPFGLVTRLGPRILVTSDQTHDDNPACPPGASCLPHNQRLVRHNPYSGLIEFRAP